MAEGTVEPELGPVVVGGRLEEVAVGLVEGGDGRNGLLRTEHQKELIARPLRLSEAFEVLFGRGQGVDYAVLRSHTTVCGPRHLGMRLDDFGTNEVLHSQQLRQYSLTLPGPLPDKCPIAQSEVLKLPNGLEVH